VTAIRQIPLLWAAPCQATSRPPMNEVLLRVHAMEQRPGIVSVTVATGYPWADVPEVGASVLVVANGDRDLAQRSADELGDWIWQHRERWYAPPLAVRQALEQGTHAGKFPIILADQADNPGGGAPGDSTEVLQTFLDLKLRDALVLYLVDPDAARQAHAAGVGSRGRFELGGKAHPSQGSPVRGEFEVVAVSNGTFTYDGPMFAGLAGNFGPSAWLRCGGVSVVVISQRMQPLDLAFCRTLGIDCRQMRYIAVKSAQHFRSGFEAIAGSIFSVDAQGLLPHDFTRLPYRRRTRPVFPIDIRPAE
jgi:microcystin degradation protein MlrC